jgi:spermidine dehydrogenase
MTGIQRRDFLNGAAIAITGLALGAAGQAEALTPIVAGPPFKRTGLRGSHAGAFEAAHAVRDGKTYDLDEVRSKEIYDLVIVGGGISGLSAAYFHRAKRPNDRILILDNHDDFGGHAKRNEFDVDGRKLIGYGGTQSIDSPKGRYSKEAMGLLTALGIDVARFDTAFDQTFYKRAGCGSSTFFKKDPFLADKLMVAPPSVNIGDEDAPRSPGGGLAEQKARIEQYPMSAAARAKVFEIETSERDVLAGMSTAEKQSLLGRISYAEYLRRYWGCDEEVLTLYRQRPAGLWGASIDTMSAANCLRSGNPGGKGVLPPRTGGGGHGEPYIYHFPDGNASIARMLVRNLIPGTAPGSTMEDIVTAPFDYSRLDRPANRIRLRLNSTAVRVRNVADGVEVGYVPAKGGRLTKVKAKAAVLACYNAMVPYIMEGVAAPQAAALHDNVKAPLVYINIALRNWRAWSNLKISSVQNPGGMFPQMVLDFPVSLGDYHFARTPDDPIVVHALFVPAPKEAGPTLREQYRAGRAQLYAMTFADFENGLRDEMTRILSPGGFDFDRDVAAITVNRWAHGYAYTAERLSDDPEVQKVRVQTARKPIGRVAIANSDAGWDAYTDVAIDQAHRAIEELAAMS